MIEPLERLMARLRAEYLTEVPQRLTEIDQAIAQFREGEPGARALLVRLFHRLAGAAGAYGFGDVTLGCREAETALKGGLEPAQAGRLTETMERLRAAFDRGPTTPPIAP